MGAHFSEAGPRFLRGLQRHNDRDWFNERKSVYEREVRDPMLAVIDQVNEGMLRFAPEHVRAPNKIAMRIYRDIRFSADKRPYKRQMGAWWVRSGLEKTSGGGFYLGIAGDHVKVGAGVFMPERDQLFAIRRHLVVHHARLRKQLRSRRFATLGMAPIVGNPLTRPPKGFSDDEAAMDLLLCREWGVSGTFGTDFAVAPGFVAAIVRRFAAAAPLVNLLNEPLLVPAKARSFVPMPLL